MNHSFWHHVPIVRLLLPFASGIGISMFYPVPFFWMEIVFLVLFICSVIVSYRLQRFDHRWVFGVIITLSMFSGGMALHQYQNELRWDTHFSYKTNATQLVIKINEQPISKATSLKMKCTVLGVADSLGKQDIAKGNLILYVRKTATAFPYRYGDVLLLPFEKIRPVSPPQNPDEFDYKRYLAFNNIYFQAYTEESQLISANLNTGNPVRKWVYEVQQYFKSVLLSCIASQNESGVAQALLYGYDDDIDAETVQAYSNTGTLHVLAVSGMHVGIIFMILGLFLKPMDRTKQLKIAKGIIILAALWLYSLLCGLSPSILRATVMFTFIIAADLLGVRSSIYNTLAASAFVLLCYDPNMLANVGFQLSYLAVIGIVFFQPYIYEWYTATNRPVDEIWKITAVSLAAQLTTFPIGLLYFHQFPNCFLFSNLIIIPLTTIILYMGMVLLAISKLSWLSWLLGQLMYYVIAFTNSVVKLVEQVPYAYVNGIQISIVQSILLYIVIGSATAYFILKRTYYIKLSLVMCILFCSLQVVHQTDIATQNRMLVYNINKHTAVHIIKGSEAILFADKELLEDKNKMKFHIQQHSWKSGISQQQELYADTLWKQVNLSDYTCLISGNDLPVFDESSVDLLLVKNKVNVDSLIQKIRPKRVIITSAVKPYQAQKIKERFVALQVPVHYVGETGATEISLP